MQNPISENQPKRGRGRPRNSVKPAKQKKGNLVNVRVTPAVFAYLKRVSEAEGVSYSDASRLLMLEAMRARGVLPAL